MNPFLSRWVEEIAQLTCPEKIHWCDGSEGEKSALLQQALASGGMEELSQTLLPGCYLRRTPEHDTARTEQLTFICTGKKEDAGPTNNWMAPREAYEKLSLIFDHSMAERTLYVIPFLMGPLGSPYSRIGVQLTDSIYVALNMRIMTRMGQVALEALGNSNNFTRCLHGKADLEMHHRFICHFPEDNTVWSVGSAYGGNALLGKKSLSLRIGSWMGQKEGWLAEHMMIAGIEDPEGNITYVAGAFPSQCGKTNLAMLVPPPSMKGWKVHTIGDDIAWLHPGPDGRLWAINPEAGFFGVAPGTSQKTNPNAMAMIQKNTIYTNVLKTPEGTVWWEGVGTPPPEQGIDWRGRHWTPAQGEHAAHPNARFTVPAAQCPSISKEWQNPQGVPVSAILFGGRRAGLQPLVYETSGWNAGVYAGATMSSETTAAAMGQTGVVRRDPMAMLPFCGYHMGQYFSHWIRTGAQLQNPPKIFHVNWFRKDSKGNFLWPGFGENLRVLQWIVERARGEAGARASVLGYIPEHLNLDGLRLSQNAFGELFNIDIQEWREELEYRKRFLETFGNVLPEEIWKEQALLQENISKTPIGADAYVHPAN
ncbi:MAG: phosphoenolpyruvate carboxykinase (GTP) [Candidatus Omnitrophica bacterium]|nr:phosphoenolpyruvate carboxykinase (GTP) [Candidatus Omnitrophota bacterium]